jgi:hypothetical protein
MSDGPLHLQQQQFGTSFSLLFAVPTMLQHMHGTGRSSGSVFVASTRLCSHMLCSVSCRVRLVMMSATAVLQWHALAIGHWNHRPPGMQGHNPAAAATVAAAAVAYRDSCHCSTAAAAAALADLCILLLLLLLH